MKKKFKFNIVWSCVSLMLATMYGTSVMSYVSAIFLSTYPASYLAYFYLGLALLFIITNKLTGHYLSRHYKKGMTTLSILFVGVIFASWQLQLHVTMPKWWPFIFCIFLITSGKFLGNNYWNGVNQVLKLREFKQNSNLLGAAVAAGGIIMGVAAAFIVKKTTVATLLPTMGGLLLANLMMLQTISVKEAESSSEPTTPFRYQYKLQKLLLVFVLVILIFSTLVDYVFKYQVKLSFTVEEIAIYTSKLSVLSNIIVLLVQFFGVKPVLQRLGIFVFILQIPVLLIACALAVIIKPNLVTISLLLIAYSVGSSSITDLAFQLLGNALPTKVRGMSKLHIKGVTLFIGSIISSGLILSLSHKATPQVISIFLLILAVFFIFLARQITKAYSETLKDSLESHHIVYSDDFYVTENMQQWGDVIEKSFSSNDYAVKLIGYELLTHKKYPISAAILDKVNEDLDDSNPAIRIEAVKLLSRHMNEKYLASIKKRLEVETDNEVIFWLFQAFDFKHHEGALEIAQKYLDSDQMLRQVGSVSILLKFGTITDAVLALNHVMAMISSTDPSARIAAARILSLFDLHGAVESLSLLIVDPDVHVSIAAIQSASAYPHKEYIPSLMQQMGVKYASYYAAKSIFSFGEEAAPLLFQRINEVHNPVFQRAAIRCISRIRGEKSESILAELMSNPSSHIRNNTVKSIAYRAMNMDFTRTFEEEIAKRVEIEKRHILDYKKLLQLELTLFETQEINALILGSTARVLYLLSTDNPKKLMPLVSLILSNMTDNDASEVLDEGIELLDSYLHKSDDRAILIAAFEEPKGDSADDILLTEERLGPWLTKVFSVKSLTYEGTDMHDLEKLVILRGCSLFKDLSADILLALAERLEVVLIPKETILFKEGDLPGDLYIVAEGEIDIAHDKQIISRKQKFDFIGELSILDEKPRTATATAVTEVVVLKMSQIEYDRILDDFPDILRTIAQTLLGYLRQYQN